MAQKQSNDNTKLVKIYLGYDMKPFVMRVAKEVPEEVIRSMLDKAIEDVRKAFGNKKRQADAYRHLCKTCGKLQKKEWKNP